MKIVLFQWISVINTRSTANLVIGFLSIMLCFSNLANSQSANDTIDASNIPMPLPSSLTFVEPYKVISQIRKIDNDNYELDIQVNLEGGYYITSAFAYNMKGRFKMKIGENDKLVAYNELTETPPAYIERFPWSSRTVKIVRNKTNYKQKVRVLTKENFDVPVSIRFVIEPRCTMEHLEFMVSSRSGKLTTKRVK